MWSIPYIDQPISFWEEIACDFDRQIGNIYLPLPDSPVGSGRSPQPYEHGEAFLRDSPLDKAVLLNVVTLAERVPAVAPRIVDALRRMRGEYGVTEAIVANLQLARRVRDALPDFSLTVPTFSRDG